MLKLVLGGSGSGKTTLLYARIKARAEAGQRSILLVPEQFTSSTEGRIYRELGDALSGMVESFSFTSLAERILSAEGGAAVQPALNTDLFGLAHAGVNYGFLALGQSVGSLAFPFAANFFGLEVGRHWRAVAAAGAGFACIRALRPVEPSAGRGQQGMDRTC